MALTTASQRPFCQHVLALRLLLRFFLLLPLAYKLLPYTLLMSAIRVFDGVIPSQDYDRQVVAGFLVSSRLGGIHLTSPDHASPGMLLVLKLDPWYVG